MGFMGFGNNNDTILDLKPNDVSKGITRLEIHDQTLSIDLDKTNNQIDLKMSQGSDPGLKDHERQKFALQIATLNDNKKRIESQLAEARKELRAAGVLHDVLERTKGYPTKIQEIIRKMDPEVLQGKLMSMAITKKEQSNKYDEIIKTGQIFIQDHVFELDTETADILEDLQARARQRS